MTKSVKSPAVTLFLFMLFLSVPCMRRYTIKIFEKGDTKLRKTLSPIYPKSGIFSIFKFAVSNFGIPNSIVTPSKSITNGSIIIV